MTEKPLLSVIVVTYCHELFIRQALDSILMQKTDFMFDVWVGDDASPDNTQTILREYDAQYPGRFHMVLREHNVGANNNALDLQQQAQGRYMAMLEGDDFWTDPCKLQKQVDFLNTHPEYVGCCHRCGVVDEHSRPLPQEKMHWVAEDKTRFTLEDHLETWGVPGQTGTLVYRNLFLDKNIDFSIIATAHPIVGDKTLMLILLTHGDFYCMPETMSAYRKIIAKDGNNWFSQHHANPYWQYDMFLYPCRVETYARKKLGIKAHIGNKKDFHFTSFLSDTAKAPSWKRIRCIAEMILKSHQPVHFIALLWSFLWKKG